MAKINNSFALYALKMLMGRQIAVKSFGVARAFDDKRRPYIAEGQQRPVHRIKRNIRKDTLYFTEDRLCRWVLICFEQRLVNRRPLRRDLQPHPPAPLLKLVGGFFVSIIPAAIVSCHKVDWPFCFLPPCRVRQLDWQIVCNTI
jgi:hypothetical protein